LEDRKFCLELCRQLEDLKHRERQQAKQKNIHIHPHSSVDLVSSPRYTDFGYRAEICLGFRMLIARLVVNVMWNLFLWSFHSVLRDSPHGSWEVVRSFFYSLL